VQFSTGTLCSFQPVLTAIGISIVSLLVLSSAYLGYYSVRLSNRLDKERLEKETLLSEKIHLNRNLEELQKKINSETEKNLELTRILEASQGQRKDK